MPAARKAAGSGKNNSKEIHSGTAGAKAIGPPIMKSSSKQILLSKFRRKKNLADRGKRFAVQRRHP